MKSITMKSKLIILLAIAVLSACNQKSNTGITQQPTLSDYAVGEKWVWKYKNSDYSRRSNGLMAPILEK